MAYFSFNNVTFGYNNKKIINNFSFSLDKGETLLIMGKSGIGKSTILKIISGLEELENGEIILDNKNITNEKIEKRNVGYLFQEFALFPHLTVYDNIGYALKKGEKKERVKELLKIIELEGYEKRYPHELSGGEKQRVALARAMAKVPKLLLLDEPFSSLNEELKDKLREDLKKILQSFNIATIIVSHDSEDKILADRIIKIENL